MLTQLRLVIEEHYHMVPFSSGRVLTYLQMWRIEKNFREQIKKQKKAARSGSKSTGSGKVQMRYSDYVSKTLGR